MKKIVFLLLSSCLFFCTSAQEKLLKAESITLDMKSLAVQKINLLQKDEALMPALDNLIKLCDKNLSFGPYSVMDKKDFPPSGDKHDYMSLAPYWWPDPNVAGGIPYIRKDGEINPEIRDYPDKENMPKLCGKVYELSLGFYFSENEKYAKKAMELIRVWFLDPATKMNPNVNYGQAVKGIYEGRAEGLIDTRHFIYLLDGVRLLKKSKSWSKQDDAALKSWFSEYYQWMNRSKNGVEEKNAKNNHGIWFDAQALSITNYLDSLEESKKIIQRALGRLSEQMDPDGSFPQELARTTSLHYSVFVLNAFESIAQLSENINVDFRNMKLRNGMTLKNAYDFITPYLIEKKAWTWPDIKHFDFENAYPLLLSASKHYICTECLPYVNGHTPEAEKLVLKLF